MQVPAGVRSWTGDTDLGVWSPALQGLVVSWDREPFPQALFGARISSSSSLLTFVLQALPPATYQSGSAPAPDTPLHLWAYPPDPPLPSGLRPHPLMGADFFFFLFNLQSDVARVS